MKIGNIEIKNQLIQAPMAGVSNEAFRLMAKKNGAGLVYGEMVSIEGILHQNQKTHKLLKISEDEHPISMQIFGNDVQSFIQATKVVNQSGADIIDLNLGCPMPKVAIKSQSGSQLLKTPDLIYEIVKAVVANTDKPVTAKIRLGWDENSVNAVEVAKLIEKAGASAIAVHGRTRAEFYSGHADWDKIKEVKQAVKIPVIGNGDVVDEISAHKMLEQTGCDAVMIARASQGNPWIFSQINHFLKTGTKLAKPNFSEWKQVVLEHAQLLTELKGEFLGVKEFRKHLAWYWDVLPKTSFNKEIKARTSQIETLKDITALIEFYEGKQKNGTKKI